MNLSDQSKRVIESLKGSNKLGDLRKVAKSLKKNQELALELWASKLFMPRMLSILIFDKKQLSEELIKKLDEDMLTHSYDEKIQLMDWLMANQLTKSKNGIALIESWQNSKSSLKRRAFWYYQGRLRWMGQKPPDNTKGLLTIVESNITSEAPEVQWAMNFTAGWIGVYDKTFRQRCIQLGEKTALYKDELVSKGCTPNYLPEFISIEAKKRNL